MKKLSVILIGLLLSLLVPGFASADNFSAVNVTQPASAAGLSIVQNGTTSNSTSVGGAFNLNNTANAGAGMVLYTNQANATGNLFSARSDSPSFTQATIYGTSQGIGPTMLLVNRSTGTDSPAANIVSTNPNFSAMGVSGAELAHGTIKVTHTGTGTDANAAALSIDLEGTGTAAQGIYVNSVPGTTGKLLFIQNQTQPRLILYSDGHLAAYGDVEITDAVHGIIMQDRAQPGTKYRVFINNGTLMTEKL